MALRAKPFVTALDIAGTAIFAIEGALAAMAGHLDLFGVLVLAFATALGGGIIRDVLIGFTPPAALRDWRYAALALAGGLLTFVLHGWIIRLPPLALIGLDAAGLALFAVAGTEKALAHNIPPFIAPWLGTITAVGGGVVRDVLLNHIPAVLRVDIYATAALAGAATLVIARYCKLPASTAAFAGFAVCFLLRLVSWTLHWQLPT
jgi:uncharacterized membrane protein YeiH